MHSLWWWHPPVGVWIGILGLLGIFVPLIRDLSKIGKYEKAVWTFVLFALLFLEIKSLYQDRNEHDIEQAQARKHEEDNFKEIAKGIRATIANSDRQFSETIGRTNQVLNNITGGDSFAYVSPQNFTSDGFPGVVWNNGEQALMGLTLTIAHTTEPPAVWGASFFSPIFIGTVGPHEHAPIPGFVFHPHPDEKSGQDHYWIMLSAQNGTVSQGLYFRKDRHRPDLWAYSFDVSRQSISGKPQAQKMMIKGKPVQNISRVTRYKRLLYRDWSDDLADELAKPH